MSGVVRGEDGAPVPHAGILVSARLEYDVFGNAFDLLHEEKRSASRRRPMGHGSPIEDGSTPGLPEALMWLESALAAHANEAGRFELRGDILRRYIAAFAPLRGPSHHFYVDACGEARLELALDAEGADVVGRVLDAHGEPAVH